MPKTPHFLSIALFKKILVALGILIAGSINASALPPSNTLEVKFWGTRGSIPVSGPQYLRYGGNTSCVSTQIGKHRLIFDFGSGGREYAASLPKNEELELHLFLSHLHMDHIIALGFGPIYDPRIKLHIYTCTANLPGFKEKYGDLKGYLSMHPFDAPHHFPIDINYPKGKLSFHDLIPNTPLEIAPGITIDVCELNHPGGANGYRLNIADSTVIDGNAVEGASMCYITDHEQGSEKHDKRLKTFIKGTDLVIIDTHFTKKDFIPTWGHSTNEWAAQLALEAGVGHLGLFHYAPARTDGEIDKIEKDAQLIFPNTFATRQGQVLTLPVKSHQAPPPSETGEEDRTANIPPLVGLGKHSLEDDSEV